MNVYINRSFKNYSLLILVAANSEKEAWEYILQGEGGEYYFKLYDENGFSLVENVSANTNVPKIVYETTLTNNFPL